MLPAENRLRRREDFTTAVRRGRRAGRPHLVVHLYQQQTAAVGPPALDTRPRFAQPPPNTSNLPVASDPHVPVEPSPPPRAGFVVSKAVGNAVARNRVKRRLRHLVGERLFLLPPGSLVVVRALPPAADVEYVALARDLDAALDRLFGRAGQSSSGRAIALPGARASRA